MNVNLPQKTRRPAHIRIMAEENTHSGKSRNAKLSGGEENVRN